MAKRVLVLGSTGGNGKLVVQDLLRRGVKVRAIARNAPDLSDIASGSGQLEVVEASVLDVPKERYEELVRDCDAVVSCLGHNMSWKGIWGKPRRLCEDAARKTIDAIRETDPKKTKFILHSTVGSSIPGDFARSRTERALFFLLRLLVPPVVDNDEALAYMLTVRDVPWVVVRPDSLVQGEQSAYDCFEHVPTSPLFNPGTTTRVHFADFVGELLTSKAMWEKWQWKCPVVLDLVKAKHEGED